MSCIVTFAKTKLVIIEELVFCNKVIETIIYNFFKNLVHRLLVFKHTILNQIVDLKTLV